MSETDHEHRGSDIYLSPGEADGVYGYLPGILEGLHSRIVSLQHDLQAAFDRIQELENARSEAQR